MAYFYTYVNPDQMVKSAKEDDDTLDLKEIKKVNMGMTVVPKGTKM